jgi:hypothetical protein
MEIHLGLWSRAAGKQWQRVGDRGVVCLGDWGIETLSNRATRDLVSSLVNATSEFPLTYQGGLLREFMIIDKDMVPGGVGITLNYPCGAMKRAMGVLEFTMVVTV